MQKQSTLLRQALIAALLSALCLLTSCSPSAPTDAIARDAWLARSDFYTRVQPGELVDFKKIDGLAAETGGVKTYAYTYEASLRCTKDWNWGYQGADPQTCKAGEIVKVSGTLRFYKSENGWNIIQ